MISERLRQQIDQWLDGDLSDDDACRLKESLEQTPEAMEFLSDRALLHGMLGSLIALDSRRLPATSQISEGCHLQETPPPKTKSRSARAWIWFSSVTAVCLLLISMLFLPNVDASPVELVEKTLVEYRAAIDRCYVVKAEAEGRLVRSKLKGRPGQSDSVLWVRGDSFVQIFDSPGDSLVWGRDRRGSVWFTISGKSAAIFGSEEIPDQLQELCDLRTLDVTTLLESLLRDYDLRFAGRTDRMQTILAKPHANITDSKFGTVEIEIDAQTCLVHAVTLERLKDNRVVSVVSFTLERIQQREDSFYDVQTHLQADAEVLEPRIRFGKRSDLLREFLLKLRLSNAWKAK